MTTQSIVKHTHTCLREQSILSASHICWARIMGFNLEKRDIVDKT